MEGKLQTRGQEPKCQRGRKAADSRPGQARPLTGQKQVTLTSRGKKTPISQGRASQREQLQAKVLRRQLEIDTPLATHGEKLGSGVTDHAQRLHTQAVCAPQASCHGLRDHR